MRLTGPNVFGPPADRAGSIALLREAVDHGVDHIDTAEYYGPAVVNDLIKEALYPYASHLVLVSKVGAARGKRGEIFAADNPDQLRRGIEDNLRSLGVEALAIVNLRLMYTSGPDAYFDDQLQAMVSARDEGLIGAIGLSNVSLAHLQHAIRFVDLACVQNEFNPLNRSSQSVLEECRRREIAFVPFAPLGFGSTSVLAHPTLVKVAAELDCTSAQVCLAWELAFAPNLLLIPGSSTRDHLHENLGADQIRVSADALHLISSLESMGSYG